MRRLFRLNYESGPVLVLDLVEAERLFGPRLEEVLPQLIENIVRKCFRELGIEKVSIREGISFIEFRARTGAEIYGFFEKRVHELMRDLMQRAGAVSHHVLMFVSREPIRDLKIKVYRVLNIPHPVSPEKYRMISRICNRLFKAGVYCSELDHEHIGVLESPYSVLSSPIKVSLDEKEFTLEAIGTMTLPLTDWKFRRFLEKLIGRVLRDKFRELGYYVRGANVFPEVDVLQSPLVDVKMGFEVRVSISTEGYVNLYLSPRSSIVAKRSLWEEYMDRDLMISDRRSLVGCRVRHEVNGLVGTIVNILDKSVDEPLDELRGKCITELYSERDISSEEPVIVISVRGALDYTAPSLLKRIYDLHELKRLGISKKVIKKLRRYPEEWVNSALELISSLGTIQLPTISIEFVEEPIEVEFSEGD